MFVLIIVPDHHQSLSYVFTETVNNSGYGGGDHVHLEPDVLVRLGPWSPARPVHDHGLRRVGAHRRGDEQSVSDGRDGDVDIRRGLGHLRLDPSARGDVCDPEHRRSAREHRRRRPLDLGRVDEPDLGRVPALHLRRGAVLLPDRVGHVGLADDVRFLARPRRSRSFALAARGEEPHPQVVGRRNRHLLVRTHDPGGLELPRRLLRRDGDRGDRPLHRLRDPCLPALSQGRQLGRAEGLEPRDGTTSGSTWSP